MGEDAAVEKGIELRFDKLGQARSGLGFDLGQKGLEVFFRHVVLGRDADCLERTRAHERVHARQTEQFGALFPFAYLACYAWALLRGRHYHCDNWFERDARRCS